MTSGSLTAGSHVSKRSKLAPHVPFVGPRGLLRSRGRTKKLSELEFGTKFPILLDAKHPLVCLLLTKSHHDSFHMGVEYIRSKVNQEFCILGLRAALRSIQSRCVLCRKRRAQPLEPVMADLPAERLGYKQPCFAFTGIDYFGPLLVTVRRSTEKRWGFLFTCLTTRAIQLKVVNSLDTSSCILAIQRFIARRDKPVVFWSDNGTNFVGAERELRSLHHAATEMKLPHLLADQGVKWKFNPPAAPHHRGSWERLVKSVKRVFYAILGTQRLRDNLLSTVFCLVEQTLNSRPLVPASSDPSDLDALTPNHFLLGRPSVSLPSSLTAPLDFDHRKHFIRAESFANAIWQKWLKEYVPILNVRSKWRTPDHDLRVGDLVWYFEKTNARGQYPMAPVLELHFGSDAIARSAKLKFADGGFTRPLTKLVPVFDANE